MRSCVVSHALFVLIDISNVDDRIISVCLCVDPGRSSMADYHPETRAFCAVKSIFVAVLLSVQTMSSEYNQLDM